MKNGLPGYLVLREILKKSEWGFGNTKECPSCGDSEPMSAMECNENGGHGEGCLLRSALDDLTDVEISREAMIQAKHKEMAAEFAIRHPAQALPMMDRFDRLWESGEYQKIQAQLKTGGDGESKEGA